MCKAEVPLVHEIEAQPSQLHSLSQHQNGVNGQLHAQDALPPRQDHPVPTK